MRQFIIMTAAAALAMSSPAAAQRMSASPTSLSNQDIVTLAGAGFSEEFIVDAIGMSRTRFDLTAPALAELAKHAVSEHIIRVMMEQQPGAQAAAVAELDPEAAIPVVMATPESPKRQKAVVNRPPAPVVVAMERGAPYYEWKSYFWGLVKKRVGAGAVPGVRQAVQVHLGPLYQQVRAPQVVPAATPVYYRVAP
jgi:hypothetical protein